MAMAMTVAVRMTTTTTTTRPIRKRTWCRVLGFGAAIWMMMGVLVVVDSFSVPRPSGRTTTTTSALHAFVQRFSGHFSPYEYEQRFCHSQSCIATTMPPTTMTTTTLHSSKAWETFGFGEEDEDEASMTFTRSYISNENEEGRTDEDDTDDDEDDDKEEEEEDDGFRWYLLNCVAGVERDLLGQCEQAHKRSEFSIKINMKHFVVPTYREAKSVGKRNVLETLVLYPGYVFAKLYMTREVFETLDVLPSCRSWMGTQRRKGSTGHQRLPSIPSPLSEEEVLQFRLEEYCEEYDIDDDDEEEDGDESNDDQEDKPMKKETKSSSDDTKKIVEEMMLEQYKGFKVEGMVKILEGQFGGEEGIVKRLKKGKISVRLFTYGSSFDEWFEPEQLRHLTELEVMRGLSSSSSSAPIDQQEFDTSIGRGRPSDSRRTDYSDDGTGNFSKRNMRRGLMSNVKGYREPRNRRQDRQDRGVNGNGGFYGEDRTTLQQEEQNWKKYQFQQQQQQQQQEQQRPRPRDRNSEGSSRANQSVDNFFDDLMAELSSRTASSDDGRDSSSDKSPAAADDDFFNSLMSELSTDMEMEIEDATTSFRNNRDENINNNNNNPDDDFFQSLMSELSATTESTDIDTPVDNIRGGERRTDDRFKTGSPQSQRQQRKPQPQPQKDQTNDDDFFDSLMSELSSDLEIANKEETTPNRRSSTQTRQKDNLEQTNDSRNDAFDFDETESGTGKEDDAFFDSLMAELSPLNDDKATSSSSGTASSPSASKDNNDPKDFFESLLSELSQEDDKLSNNNYDSDSDDGHQASIPTTTKPMPSSSSSTTVKATKHSENSSSTDQVTTTKNDLSKLTVPVLKLMLKERGLKVSGKKAELIERLQ